jgi:hypothetical protein
MAMPASAQGKPGRAGAALSLSLWLVFNVAAAGTLVVEDDYLQLRNLKDTINAVRVHVGAIGPDPAELPALVHEYNTKRAAVVRALRTIDVSRLAPDDRRAVDTMRATVDALGAEPATGEPAESDDAPAVGLDCDFDPAALARTGMEALSSRMYACFGAAAGNLMFEGESLDRLTVFAKLATTEAPDRRRALFLSLAPVWNAVNGDGGVASPWRTLIRLSAARMRAAGNTVAARAVSLGVDPARVEPWLLAILARWRDNYAKAELEPWDFHFAAGAMERALAPRIPLHSIQALNDRVYRELGADPAALRIHYDIAFRAGKDPVAHTDFLSRPEPAPLPGGRGGEVRVSAAYRVGGPGNLAELLHETGHGIHIAAIRTRPAFADWPDSDVFSEALGDLVALDMYNPAWQRRYLGANVPPEQARFARYAGIALDTAWALFEIRMHRGPDLDPNQIWTDITREYLRIRAHPEWSWWAIRGQLVSNPGYMLNYALGAVLAADLRARTRELFGAQPWGDTSWYGKVAERLFRFGLEKPGREVIESYLGRPVSPDALLADMSP